MRSKPKAFVQLAELPKTDGWKTKEGKVVPFDSMKTEALQEALQQAEARQMYAFNTSNFFGVLVEKIESELEKRGEIPQHHQTNFAEKNAQARKKSKQP